MATISCYAHAEANQLYLGFEEILYGFPNRSPLGRAGVLFIRKSDLPAKLPRWPANNLFDLSYEPYSQPRVRELVDSEPEEKIPLGIYVLGGTLHMKPTLVVDFFDAGNPKRRKATGILKVLLDHLLSFQNMPLTGRILKATVEYALVKKDITYFRKFSNGFGGEVTRLYARFGWNLDPDLNHQLIKAMEKQIANPLVEAASREERNLLQNFRGLLIDDGARLGLMLRKLYEDRIRESLGLGNKAVFAQDLARFSEYQAYSRSRKAIQKFNRAPHLSSLSRNKLVAAWSTLQHAKFSGHEAEVEVFVRRFKERFPQEVLPDQGVAVQSAPGGYPSTEIKDGFWTTAGGD
jgi:hypothetical protein